VAYPHYFLQPTGAIADQLKAREWIVARITSITEKIANSQVSRLLPSFLTKGTRLSSLNALIFYLGYLQP
jgi:autophagy-related protein 11